MKSSEKIETIQKRINEISGKLSGLSSDVDSEQDVLNKEIDSYVQELDEYSIYINYELQKEIAHILSNNNKDLSKYEKISATLKNINTYDESEKYYLSSSGLDKILYNISYSKDVNKINDNIKILIENLKKYDIEVNVNDFNFSHFTTKYMTEFTSSLDNPDFSQNMKKYFDEIYWICPNIIKHLVLNIIEIIEKNKKIIYKKIIEKRQSLINALEINKDKLDEEYLTIKNNYNILSLKDTAYLYDFFKDNTSLLKEYTKNNYEVIKTKYINETNINDELLIDNIRNFRLNIEEYININKFKYIIDYIKDIINDKNKIESVDKKYQHLLKEKNNSNSKIIKLDINQEKKTIFYKNKNKIDKKKRINNAYLINEVDALYQLKIDGNINNLNEDIKNALSENSSIYEALKIVSKHYLALANIIYNKNNAIDVIDELKQLEKFLYSGSTFIIRNTPIDKLDNIKTMIEKKYTLCNINSSINYESIPDLNQTIKDLLYLEINYNLTQKEINFTDISICISKKQD